MKSQTLQEHYEQKYANEAADTVIEPILVTRKPVTRFEAFVKYFPKYFMGGDVIELGAGSGNIAQHLLLHEATVNRYVISDFSSNRIKGIQRNMHDPRLDTRLVDAEKVPESEYGQYDAVVMIALIEHLLDPLLAMQSIRKLLKPGGFIYIDTPNIAKYTRRLKLMFGRFPSTASLNEGLTQYSGQHVDLYDEGHLHYFTFRSLSLMLTERCGFSKVEKCGYPGDTHVLGKNAHSRLSLMWPNMFSELAVIAYA